jgi:predicted ABC-type ATPase
VILVGGNGSGQSTYFNLYIKQTGLAFVNADLIAKGLFGEEAEKLSLNAARIAEDTRNRLLLKRQSFCFETVFSHPSKIDFLAQAIPLFDQFVLLDNSSLESPFRLKYALDHGAMVYQDEVLPDFLPKS